VSVSTFLAPPSEQEPSEPSAPMDAEALTPVQPEDHSPKPKPRFFRRHRRSILAVTLVVGLAVIGACVATAVGFSEAAASEPSSPGGPKTVPAMSGDEGTGDKENQKDDVNKDDGNTAESSSNVNALGAPFTPSVTDGGGPRFTADPLSFSGENMDDDDGDGEEQETDGTDDGAFLTDNRPHDKLITWLTSASIGPSDPFWGKADPFVVITTLTNDDDDDPLGVRTCRYKQKNDVDGPVSWPRKRVALFPRGEVANFRIKIFDADSYSADDLLLEGSFPIPEPSANWTEHTVKWEDHEVTFKVRVRSWEDKIVSAGRIAAFALEEQVFSLANDEGAVLQHHIKEGNDKAILWFPGRNDAWFHPHVGEALDARGFDVYVLNYRRVGVCRRLGLFENPYLNSHCPTADFAEYHEEINLALAFMAGAKEYTTMVGYGFSTGGPVLLSWMMAQRAAGLDDPFTGYVFNAPFVDWGQGGVTEYLLETLPSLLLAIPGVPTTLNVDPAFDPDGVSSRGIVIRTDYEFDPRTRPLYQVPVTAGFVQGSNAVHEGLRRLLVDDEFITDKPTLVLFSDADDVLDTDEIEEVSKVISSDLKQYRFASNSHDAFINDDPEDNDAALDVLTDWLDEAAA